MEKINGAVAELLMTSLDKLCTVFRVRHSLMNRELCRWKIESCFKSAIYNQTGTSPFGQQSKTSGCQSAIDCVRHEVGARQAGTSIHMDTPSAIYDL